MGLNLSLDHLTETKVKTMAAVISSSRNSNGMSSDRPSTTPPPAGPLASYEESFVSTTDVSCG